MKSKWLVGVCMLALTGCNVIQEKRSVYLRDRGKDYLSSELIQPLQVPENLEQYHSQVFPLPDSAPERIDLDAISLRPPGFGEALQES